jgi:hypothetical protein
MGITLTRQEEEAVKNLLLDMATAIPPLNVVAGIRDITSTGWDLYRQNYKTPEEENELKLQLILGIVCLIPGAGAPVRTTFRQLTRNPDFYGPLMFEIITRIIEQANVLMVRNNFRPIPVNPEAFLMQLIDIGRLERELESARKAALASAKDSVFGRWFDVSGTINACFDFLKRNLADCLRLLSRYVRNAITKSQRRSNNSAKQQISAQNTQKPSQRLPTNNTKRNSDKPNKTTTSGEMKARINSLAGRVADAFTGGIGEHIADYYCLEKFGNPSDWSGHDKGSNGKWRKKDTAYKLNDNGVLKRLKPSDNRGGIDSLWKTPKAANHGKEIAVIEVKSTRSHLWTEAKMVDALGYLSPAKHGRLIIQMDHDWIVNDLRRMLTMFSMDIQLIFKSTPEKFWKTKYHRHILFINVQIPGTEGFKHAEVWLEKGLKGEIDEQMHRNHKPNHHIFDEARIDRLITAKKPKAQREYESAKRRRERRKNQAQIVK